jgi:hypothetical protein
MGGSKYDLYSKSKVRADVEKLKPYYLSLIHKVPTTALSSCCDNLHSFASI